MFRRVVPLTAVVVVALVAVGSRSSEASTDDRQALRQFQDAVDRYMTLRQHLERHWPLLVMSDDMQELSDAVAARRHAVVRARDEAKPGDIFNAAVGDLFRSRIAQAFAAERLDPAILLSEMNEDGEQWQRAIVNGRFRWSTASATPAAVLAVLPPLPDNLQYRRRPRFVLVDIDAASSSTSSATCSTCRERSRNAVRNAGDSGAGGFSVAFTGSALQGWCLLAIDRRADGDNEMRERRPGTLAGTTFGGASAQL